MPGKVGAFYDFDRTVIDGDGGYLFGRELVRLRWRRLWDDRPGTIGWLGRLTAYLLRYLFFLLAALALRPLYWLKIIKRSTLVRTAYLTMRGWRVEEVEELAKDFFDEALAARIYPDALKSMHAHKAKRHQVVVCTTNMRILVDHVRRHTPASHVIGAEFVVRDGRLTGRVTGPLWGRQKAEATRDWAHTNGVSLPLSHAYSDHYSDHEFLGLFGHPHVVNGDFRLRRMARKKGWTLHHFAKPKL